MPNYMPKGMPNSVFNKSNNSNQCPVYPSSTHQDTPSQTNPQTVNPSVKGQKTNRPDSHFKAL